MSMSHVLAGLFWIDPNGGGVADAIQVFCKFSAEDLEETQTCLVPTTSKVSNI